MSPASASPVVSASPESAARNPASAFDYGQLDAAVAEAARSAAERFRRRSETYFMDTGRDLLAIKDRLEHGLFLRWVEAEMGLTPRTAQNFMQAAARLGHKSEIVSHLPPTTLYRLAAPSTPEHVREEVLELAAQGRIEPKAVDHMVAAGRAKAKEAQLAAEGPRAKANATARGKKRVQDRQRAATRHEPSQAKHVARVEDEPQRAKQAARKAADYILERLEKGDLAALTFLLNQADPGMLRAYLLTAARGLPVRS